MRIVDQYSMLPVTTLEKLAQGREDALESHESPETKPKSRMERLNRLYRIWQMLCSGYNMLEISEQLGIHYSTVQRYVTLLYALAKEKMVDYISEVMPGMVREAIDDYDTLKKMAYDRLEHEKSNRNAAELMRVIMECDTRKQETLKNGPLLNYVMELENKIRAIEAIDIETERMGDTPTPKLPELQ